MCKDRSFQLYTLYVCQRGCTLLKGKNWEVLIVLEEGGLFPKQLFFSKYEGRHENLKYCTSQKQLGNSKSRLPLCPFFDALGLKKFHLNMCPWLSYISQDLLRWCKFCMQLYCFSRSVSNMNLVQGTC